MPTGTGVAVGVGTDLGTVGGTAVPQAPQYRWPVASAPPQAVQKAIAGLAPSGRGRQVTAGPLRGRASAPILPFAELVAVQIIHSPVCSRGRVGRVTTEPAVPALTSDGVSA